MSWLLFVMPAHLLVGHEREMTWAGIDPADVVRLGGEWVPFPTVEQVLTALAAAGCHGEAGYELEGFDDPLPASWDETGHRDDDFGLGEVSLHAVGGGRRGPRQAEDRVEYLCLRKPRGATLRAAMIMASLGGPQFAFDDGGSVSRVVLPAQRREDLEADWPWDRRIVIDTEQFGGTVGDQTTG